ACQNVIVSARYGTARHFQPIEQRENVRIQEINVLGVLRREVHAQVADHGATDDAARGQQPLLGVMVQFHALEAVNNLGQHSLENLVCLLAAAAACKAIN